MTDMSRIARLFLSTTIAIAALSGLAAAAEVGGDELAVKPAEREAESAAQEQAIALLHRLSRGKGDASAEYETQQRAVAQTSFAVVERNGRVRSAYDELPGGLFLDRPGDVESADRTTRSFLEKHAQRFGISEQPAAVSPETVVRESRGLANQRLTYQQYYRGLPVVDGNFAAFFDSDGAFRGLSGAPWPDRAMPRNVRPRIDEQTAVAAAIEHVQKGLESDSLRKHLNADAELMVSGGLRRLVWKVMVLHSRGLGVERELLIAADNGEILSDYNLIAFGAEPVSVRYLLHPGGVKDATPAGGENPPTALTSINVNPEPFGSACLVRLQRLGSGRARMWNARLSGGTTTDPLFGATMTLGPCDDLRQLTLFRQEPETSSSDDSTWRFNEQTTYVRAQILKTQLDNWGRRSGSNYGYYYPVDSGRDVNVEIVVNGDSLRESDWCGVGVMHGCSRNNAGPSMSDWFPNVDIPRVVFLFNSAGNSGSPQFVGVEQSPSYSIIAHEVGHFISWTYGGWPGTSSNMRGSLNEGMSMALPAVWGKERFGTALDYTDSIEVTTGSRVGGAQWAHHSAGNPLRYDSLGCTSENRYKLAWPWVQAMWELANNRDAETGDAIWTSDSAASRNTADFLMDILYTQAGVSDRDWNDIATRILVHQLQRHLAGRERGARPNFESFFRTVSVLSHHGLFNSCQP